MESLYTVKTREIADTPLVLFECQTTDGTIERWSTHAVTYEGNAYDPIVLRHNLFEMQAGSAEGVDGTTRLALTIGNASGRLTEIERRSGWKGAKLTRRGWSSSTWPRASRRRMARWCFAEWRIRRTRSPKASMRLSFANRLNLQRLVLPQLRIQRRCPWCFPQSAAQRLEAVDGGARGRVFGVLCVRILGGPDGRVRESQRWSAVRLVRIYEAGLRAARHVR